MFETKAHIEIISRYIPMSFRRIYGPSIRINNPYIRRCASRYLIRMYRNRPERTRKDMYGTYHSRDAVPNGKQQRDMYSPNNLFTSSIRIPGSRYQSIRIRPSRQEKEKHPRFGRFQGKSYQNQDESRKKDTLGITSDSSGCI